MKDFNGLFDENEIIKDCFSVEILEQASHLKTYLRIVNKHTPSKSKLTRFQHDIILIIRIFLRLHKCCNPSCAGFSYLKCKRCKTAHYCNVKCQSEHWGEHQQDCKFLALEYKMESWASKRIQKLVENNAKCPKCPRLKGINLPFFIKLQRWQWFSNSKEKSFLEQELRSAFCKLGYKEDSPIVDKILTKKTYRTLLNSKCVKKQRAIAEVD